MKPTIPTFLPSLLLLLLGASWPGGVVAQDVETCIGRFCGRELGFPVEHCHIRPGGDVDGDDYCWSSASFDRTCEQMGYTVNLPCPEGIQGPGQGLGSVGGLLTLSPTLLGGYDTFRSQIRAPALSRAQRAAEEAEEEEDEEEEPPTRPRFSAITTALEHEQWDFAGADGDTNGLRFDWERQTERGALWGLSASYQEANPDQGESSELLRAQVDFGHTFAVTDGSEWRWAVHGTVADLSGLVSDTLFGGGGSLSYRRYAANGHVFSAGVLAQYQTADDLDDDVQAVGAGLGYGLPLGQRLTLDFEVFGTTLLDDATEEDTFYTAATMLGVYLSPRFVLTLGARTLQGIDDLDSTTFTLGSSTRF